jgi:hypothetical protein
LNPVPPSQALEALGGAVAVGDFNADGLTDIALTYGGFLEILFGDGDGGFPSSQAFPPTDSSALYGSIAAGDFNGDGLLDLALATGLSFSTNELGFQIFYSQSDGGLLASPVYATMPLGAYEGDVAAGDLNGDGRLDVAVLDDRNGVRVYLAADGGFDQPIILPLPPDNQTYQSLAIGDVNGDGLDDVVVSAFNINQAFTDLNALSVFVQRDGVLTAGGAVAAERLSIPTIAENTVYLFSDCDIGVSRYVDGGLQSAEDLAVSCGLAWGGAVGDLNGDGLTDLVATDPYSDKLYVFLAHSASTYGAPALVHTGLPQNGLFDQPLAIGDFNLDGRADVVVTGMSGTSVLLNSCQP